MKSRACSRPRARSSRSSRVRRGELLETLADEIEGNGGVPPLTIVADLYDRAAPEQIRERVLGEFGNVDILVNNAGGSRKIDYLAADELWDEAFAINFTAVRKLAQAFLPAMTERNFGRIINITGSSEPLGVNAANAAKAGVHAWAKGLSREVGKFGITVNSLAPGAHSQRADRSARPPHASRSGRVRQAQHSGRLLRRTVRHGVPGHVLCSPKARYVNGERIHVDGGLHRFL